MNFWLGFSILEVMIWLLAVVFIWLEKYRLERNGTQATSVEPVTGNGNPLGSRDQQSFMEVIDLESSLAAGQFVADRLTGDQPLP